MFVLTLGVATASRHWLAAEPWPEAAACAVGILGILLAHELGHYVVARRHGFELSLPLFIPFPSLFGTLGAVIQLRSEPRSRQALLEMGAAGPLAGFVVAVLLVWAGMHDVRPPPEMTPGQLVGVSDDPLIVKLLGTWVNGAPPGRYVQYGPMASAGWAGCFLTGMNLVPIGQLDGGHVVNALVPGVARYVTWAVMAAFLVLGMGWSGWWVWLGVLLVTRASVPLPRVPLEPGLPWRSRVVVALVLVAFVLSFIPVPFTTETVGG